MIVASADLPDDERTVVFDAMNERVTGLLNPFAAIALPNYRKHLVRAEAAHRRLDALVLAAVAGAVKAETGRWPASTAELASAGELEDSEAARLAEAALVPADGDTSLSVRVPLPQAAAEDPAELVLVLGSPRTARDEKSGIR